MNASSGDTVTGDESTTANPYIDSITVTEGTNYFHVRPKNGAGTWGTERIFIVKYDKTNPSVDAGVDQAESTQFLQDATVSDATSGVASYQWSKTSGSGTITFGTPNAEDTTVSANVVDTYIIRLTVTDNVGNSAYDEFTLTWQAANTLPVASSVSIDSGALSVALTEGTTHNVVCAGTVTDDDGYADITSVTAKLYRSAVGAGGGDDNANHYTLTGDGNCIPSGGLGNTETYTCTFPVYFYADPTDAGSSYEAQNWECEMTPTDTVGAGTADTDTIEMASLTALSATASINYSAIALGADTGTTDQTTIITNTGNRTIDAQVDGYGAEDGDGYSMTCTIGTVTIGSEKYSLSASTAYASKDALTDTAFQLTAFNLAQGASSTKDIYWGMGLPASGVGSSCSGKVNFTAVNH
ncbi:MAG: hypothetical protein Q8Q48_00730 [Candidatus Staskawiczbacteria bacterium]|nr:hypothetical protein [Candidatus Staskawiczbacteria bacterium]